jgi:predicted nucleotidyltransferase
MPWRSYTAPGSIGWCCSALARGDASEESDYDVAVFLNDMPDRQAEWLRLADLRLRFLDEGGPFFEAIPFRASDYEKRTPLMSEIRRDGLAL